MLVEPAEIAVTRPELVTVATETELELQAADELTSPTEPSENVAEAENCCCCPVVMVMLLGFTVMELIVLLLTVMGAVAVTLLLLDLAVMVVLPRATAVASPEVSMVATLVEDDSQVTCEVTSPVVLLPKVAVAVNCAVVVGVIHALVGDNASAVMESEAGKNPLQLLRSTATVIAAVNFAHCVSRRILVIEPPKLPESWNGKHLCPAFVSPST